MMTPRTNRSYHGIRPSRLFLLASIVVVGSASGGELDSAVPHGYSGDVLAAMRKSGCAMGFEWLDGKLTLTRLQSGSLAGLASLKTVRTMSLWGYDLPPHKVKSLLKRCPGLATLQLYSRDASILDAVDDDCKGRLKGLTLVCDNMNTKQLSLGEFRNLEELVLVVRDYDRPIKMDGLMRLSKASKLRRLVVNPVATECWLNGREYGNLQSLVLCGCTIDGSGLRSLRDLRALVLCDCQITSEGIHVIASLAKLRNLTFASGCVFEGVTDPVDLSHLNTLTLDAPQNLPLRTIGGLAKIEDVTLNTHGAEMLELEGLESLSALRIMRVVKSAEVLKRIRSLKRLRKLELYCLGMQEQEFRDLLAHRGLEALEVSHARIYPDAVAPGRVEGGTIKSLKLSLTDTHGTSLFRAIGALSGLKELTLYDLRVTNSNIEQLRHLDLKALEVVYNYEVSDDACETIAGFKRLERLDLSETGISDVGLKYLTDLKRLKTLRLCGLNVSDVGARWVAKMDLDRVAINGTLITPSSVLSFRAKKVTWARLWEFGDGSRFDTWYAGRQGSLLEGDPWE